MEVWSRTDCVDKTRGMEEWVKTQDGYRETPVESCAWYHGTWQYLRLLDMVATPSWYGFYNSALSEILRNKPRANVLISAAADYGMLATLHRAIEAAQGDPSIVIYDICRTPLRSCEWYADRYGLTVKTVRGDLLEDGVPEAPFDLIVTDEFLTVLKAQYKPMITQRWRELLRPGGSVVTTAMIGGATTPELRDGYARRARQLLSGRLDSFPHHNNGKAHLLVEHFDRFAGYHTRHMIDDEDQIRTLFSDFDELSYSATATPGECVTPTNSFQIVASLR
ncbi:MAG: class I SAM-dependent methyltransferase [Acidobacteriia bacterium]|nr:class I SAM-dependent methyltransferase [Terriglobia bacterium]